MLMMMLLIGVLGVEEVVDSCPLGMSVRRDRGWL